MRCVRCSLQNALHIMSVQRATSTQEDVHKIDNQDLVVCAKRLPCLSLQQGTMLTIQKDNKKEDIISMY